MIWNKFWIVVFACLFAYHLSFHKRPMFLDLKGFYFQEFPCIMQILLNWYFRFIKLFSQLVGSVVWVRLMKMSLRIILSSGELERSLGEERVWSHNIVWIYRTSNGPNRKHLTCFGQKYQILKKTRENPWTRLMISIWNLISYWQSIIKLQPTCLTDQITWYLGTNHFYIGWQ